jgi:glycosyltransferase involved in cell wall biosynthesis
MSYSEVLSLYASSDSYLSLHRSEGFGLGLIEAMGLGKPVIATGWSGNRAYMDPTNSCLVSYGLTPVKAINWAYVQAMRGLDPVWAEPKVRDAALWLQRLAADSALAARIGIAAKRSFDQYQERAAKAEFIDQVTALRQHQVAGGRSNERRASILRRLDRARQQIRDDAQTPPQRLLHKICKGFGRHVGWRFSRSPD